MSQADPRCVFLSDVHLSPGGMERMDRFQGFLSAVKRRTDRIYILGDLFDYWVGPSHLELDDYRPVLKALRRFTDGGPEVHFVPGNRDYLVGPEFERATGMRLHPANAEVTLGGRRVHLAHGDFRAALPTVVAVRLAARFRGISLRETPKAPFRSRTDLLAPALRLFRQGVDVVVCGHLHREEHLQAPVDGTLRDLFLLGEWSEGCPHLAYERGRFEMKRTV
jgi:UDP-2,3-diacylglucosamine pyrophosphatase LpxH